MLHEGLHMAIERGGVLCLGHLVWSHFELFLWFGGTSADRD